MATTIPSPPAGLRAWRQRGFGRLVLTEGMVWVRGSNLCWALLFPSVLLLGMAAITPELREIASGASPPCRCAPSRCSPRTS